MEFHIDGRARLHEVAKAIRATGDKGLGREMGKALAATTTPLREAIDAEAARVMPVGGGYQAVLSRSLRHKTSQRTGSRSATIRLITYADGTGERRDVEALEKGVLRHPVFGRSRNTRAGRVPNPWAITKIRSGFHQRGTANAGDEAQKRLLVVLDDFAARLTKG
jgi:hypothetical protein